MRGCYMMRIDSLVIVTAMAIYVVSPLPLSFGTADGLAPIPPSHV